MVVVILVLDGYGHLDSWDWVRLWMFEIKGVMGCGCGWIRYVLWDV